MNPVSIFQPKNLDDLQRFSKMALASQFFGNASNLAQACLKIQMGAELGLAPVQALNSIQVIKGKPTMSANLMAALVKRAGYSYTMKMEKGSSCTLTFFSKDGRELGESNFTMSDAKRAGLKGGAWQKYPDNMLFARAISNGARWFAPEIILGFYSTEEMIGPDLHEPIEEIRNPKIEPPPSSPKQEVITATYTKKEKIIQALGKKADDPVPEKGPCVEGYGMEPPVFGGEDWNKAKAGYFAEIGQLAVSFGLKDLHENFKAALGLDSLKNLPAQTIKSLAADIRGVRDFSLPLYRQASAYPGLDSLKQWYVNKMKIGNRRIQLAAFFVKEVVKALILERIKPDIKIVPAIKKKVQSNPTTQHRQKRPNTSFF